MEDPYVDFTIDAARDYPNWWIDEFQHDIERKFNSTDGPLWRVTIYENQHEQNDPTVLIFTFHHCAFDGGSIMSFYNKFLTLCAAFDEDDSRSDVFAVPPRPGIYRNPMEIWNHPVSWWKGISTLLGGIFNYVTGKYAVTFSPDLFNSPGLENPEEEAHTRIYPFSLEGDVLSELKSKCKANSVTIHSAISAAALLAYINSYNGKHTRSLCIQNPLIMVSGLQEQENPLVPQC